MAKILIIDDSVLAQEVMRESLETAGFKDIVVASNGEEGIAKASVEHPDVVVLDTVMPGMNGFEACQKIKAQDDAKKTKVVMLTGNIDAVDAVKARQAGCDDYVVKTSDNAPLIGAVKKLV